MADPITDGWIHQGGFAGLSRRVGVGEGVRAVERAGFAAAIVIARRGKVSEAAGALGSLFGLAVADGPKRAASADVTVLGTGPGTWLVLADRPDLLEVLGKALQGLAAIIDQSDGQAILHLSGPRLAEVLERGVRIDLHPSRFTAADVAVTAIAHVGATLWKPGDGPDVMVAVPRSLAGSLLHWLEASARGVGLTVEAD